MESGGDINCDAKSGDGDDNFVWQDYLDVTNSVQVPNVLFSHVEQSLLSGLQAGMILEVPHKLNGDSHWVASIVMACGPLLSLRYIGQEDNRSKDFWYDLSKVSGHPIGWCKQQGLKLEPPSELQDRLTDCEDVIERAIQNAPSIPAELLTGDGFTPVDRIKQGMKVEVQDKLDPMQLWVATIIENVGGRLLLRYDTPDSTSPDFWLFYNSPRLFRIGTVAERGLPWMLLWPSYMQTQHGTEEWEAVMEMAKEDARRMPLPPDLFQNSPPTMTHLFEEGMKLEAVHPHNMVEICPASVVKVYDEYYFLVQIDSHASMEADHIDSTWLCTAEHPYIFPVGWALDRELQLTHPRGWTTDKEEFDWAEYLDETNSMPAPHYNFPLHTSATELGFAVNMKLEAMNPENHNQICAATIIKMIDHLLWLHLDSHDSFHPCHIVSVDSLDIFPVGWCESNSYPLKAPCFYQSPAKPEPQNTNATESKENGSSPQQRSFWCPKIYFNHKCFSGPFLSKGKLAQLPKAVGPGPVTLVMREVLTMLISVAYKSSRVLKELQADGKPDPGMHLEVLKAKYKTNTYRASVAVVTSADQVPAFCKGICARLLVCPYMFGPILVGENSCPENCNTLSKTKFNWTHMKHARKSDIKNKVRESPLENTASVFIEAQYWVPGKRKIGRPKGESSNLMPRPKKKRGRKGLIGAAKPETEGNADGDTVGGGGDYADATQPNTDGGNESDASREDCNADPNSEPNAEPNAEPKAEPNADPSSSSASSPTDSGSANGLKRKHCKKDFPKSGIKTRGAKLPNFALQMRAGHWPQKDLMSSHSESLRNGDKNHNHSADSPPAPKHFKCSNSMSTQTDSAVGKITLMKLESNPENWTKDDVYQYLINSQDCSCAAQACKDELIDGAALMMLNLPTVRDFLKLRAGAAIKLCTLIENLRLAHYFQYIVGNET